MITFWMLWFCVLIIIIVRVSIHAPKCDRCKSKMKLMKSTGDLSVNVSPKVTLSLLRGIPEKRRYTYKCPSCGFKKLIKRKSWK